MAGCADLVRELSEKKRRRDRGIRIFRASRTRSLSRKDAAPSSSAALRNCLFGAASVAWLHRVQEHRLGIYAGHGRRRFHSGLHFTAGHFAGGDRSSVAPGGIRSAKNSGSGDLFPAHWLAARRGHHRGEHRRFFRSPETISAPWDRRGHE